LLHLKGCCIQYPTSNYLRLQLCRLCSYSYNTTPFIRLSPPQIFYLIL
jgi:hypothetical protein